MLGKFAGRPLAVSLRTRRRAVFGLGQTMRDRRVWTLLLLADLPWLSDEKVKLSARNYLPTDKVLIENLSNTSTVHSFRYDDVVRRMRLVGTRNS